MFVTRAGSSVGKRVLTVDERSWLQSNWSNPTAVASHLNVCRDTAIRILVREGLSSTRWGAKYTANPADDVQMWQRPCSNCGCEKSRPKWQYRCDTCKSKSDRDFYYE